MLVLIRTISVAAAEDSCTLKANTITDITYIQNCLQKIQFDETVGNRTIDALQGLLGIYAFRKLANQTNQFDIAPVDIVGELEKQRDKKFDSDFDFHVAMCGIFHKLYDAHTRYVLPTGYKQFYATTGFHLVYKKEEGQYQLEVDRNDIGKQVLKKMNRTDFKPVLVDKINDTDPVEFIMAAAKKISTSVKDHNARYNDYVSRDFHQRGLGTYGSLFVNESLSIMYNGNETLVLRYYIYSIRDITGIQDIITMNTNRSTWSQNPPLREERLEHPHTSESSDGKIKKLTNGTTINAYSYNDNEAYLLTVPTFSPDDVEAYVAEFQNAMSVLAELPQKKLIINVASNGGGYITLGYRMLGALFPYIKWPLWGNYSIINSNLNNYFLTNKDQRNTFAAQERFNQFNGNLFRHNEFMTTKNTNQHSGTYSFDLAYDEAPKEVYESLLATKIPDWLNTADNDKVVIVTDGLCGSTCACFADRAIEAGVATFFQLGGKPEPKGNEGDLMAAASFAGGSVMRTTYTDQFNLSEFKIAPLPTTAVFSWAHEMVYSWVDPRQSLEYKYLPVHDRLNVHYDQDGWYSDAKLAEIAEAVIEKFKEPKCYDFMFQTAGCEQKSDVHGKKCYKGAYSSTCELIMCGKGRRMGADEKCEPAPKKSVTNSQNALVGAVIGSILAVMAAISITIIIISERRKTIRHRVVTVEESAS